MTPGGASGPLLGIDAVREFNLLRDDYGAGYGKKPGGQVSIVTQSGSNEWHGTVFEFLRNNALDAKKFLRCRYFGLASGLPVQSGESRAQPVRAAHVYRDTEFHRGRDGYLFVRSGANA